MSAGSDERDMITVPLACGHPYSAHECSSTWDFPADAVWCAECKDLRQLALHIQLLCMEDES